jgi:hypothetical protein
MGTETGSQGRWELEGSDQEPLAEGFLQVFLGGAGNIPDLVSDDFTTL